MNRRILLSGVGTIVAFAVPVQGQAPDSAGGATTRTGDASSRSGAEGVAGTYDAARDRLVLFGGGGLDGTWEWSRSRWERRR